MDTVTEKMNVKTKRKYIDNREFVVAYMTCRSIDEVAETMRIRKAAAISKATDLRKMGVKLPKRFARGSKLGRELEIAQLNSLIKKYVKVEKE